MKDEGKKGSPILLGGKKKKGKTFGRGGENKENVFLLPLMP